MFDAQTAQTYRLTDARVVTPRMVVHGSVAVEDGKITEIGAPDAAGIPMNGDYLIPGLIDVHTDHVETHAFPRPRVHWAPEAALAAHDAVVTAAGITTVLDSLSVGATLEDSARRGLLKPLVEAIEAGQSSGRFRANHLLHLRCEICDPGTVQLVDETIGSALVRLVSIMDHTPGDRQIPDVDAWIRDVAEFMQISLTEAETRTAELLERSARVGPGVKRHVIDAANAAGVPLMSHDDRTVAHVDEALADGVTVSEFPTTLAAARRARETGQLIVAGAPNYVRGGSQSGNVAVKDLLSEQLVDILASDYVPGSLLAAAFSIADDPDLALDLPQAIALVSSTPAEVLHLSDRGRIEEGLNADLVRVDRIGHHPHVAGVWRCGRRVY